MANENKINWTLVVLGTILCVGLYLIPSPLQPTNRVVVHTRDTTWVVLGVADTSGTPVPSVTGSSTSIVTSQPTNTDSGEQAEFDYFFYSELKDSTKEGNKVYIQAFTYPYEENDSIKAKTILNYEISPRPAMTIVKTDTVFTIKFVDVPRPFYEEPEFVIPVTASVTLGVVYLISRIFK